MNKLNIYAMIPARYGSTRLKMKNLALINGQPMISYAINASKKSKVFDKIIVNSEHNIFKQISLKHNVSFYHRPSDLASSKSKSDSVVADFMQEFPEADIVVWVNPIAPFQTSDEVAETVRYFLEKKLDSLITVQELQVHCNYKDQPINYSLSGLFAQTQDLNPVQLFVYSLMMWRRKTFLKEFSQKGNALFCGKFGTYSVSKTSGFIIKTSEDLKIADLLMQSLDKFNDEYIVEYDDSVSD